MQMSSDDRLTQARLVLENRGIAAADLLNPAISASWTRCLQSGLDPHRPPRPDSVSENELHIARERAELVRSLALAEMKDLYHQIAGSNFLIAFAAPDGLLLDTIADASFRAAARTASIRPGSLWTEQRCGTNALGTAAQIAQAVTVHGGEHFFASFGALTCTASPVVGPDGTLAGTIDASSHCGSRQQHTQALVAMAATQVENGLFRHHHRDRLIVAFHSRGEYLHTLSAGLLAIDPDGVLRGVTPRAKFLLQGLPASAGRHFDDLFRTPFRVLLGGDRHDHRRLDDRVGSAFVAALENAHRLMPPTLAVRTPLSAADTSLAEVDTPDFVANDPTVAAAARRVAAASRRGLPILIRGETGTGKELLARHAHRVSGRRGPFVPVNCAALPESLIEAELFGHADGAFTGARRGGNAGLVCEADGGTLFLDEIGDMRAPLQSVLLRLLDDWQVRPVGGGRARRVDVLLVAATNAAVEQAVAERRFRADLFYRLDTVSVTLPPLRLRSDLRDICRRLLADIAPGCSLSEDAVQSLSAHSWPGNNRELRNVLTRLSLEPNAVIEGADITAVLGMGTSLVSRLDRPASAPERSLREASVAQIKAAHRDAGGNLSEAARRLGVSRNTVYRAIGKRAASS